MPNKLQDHHIKLFAGDFERLKAIYTDASPNYVIRKLVRNHCDAVEAKLREGVQHERQGKHTR